MLDDKMALLPLKISDAYLLVWGVLCLVIGISLFGQYSYGWLASISAVMLGTSTSIWQLAGGTSLSVTTIIRNLTPRADGVMLFSGKQLIVTAAEDNTQISTTKSLADFWQSNIRIVLGARGRALHTLR